MAEKQPQSGELRSKTRFVDGPNTYELENEPGVYIKTAPISSTISNFYYEGSTGNQLALARLGISKQQLDNQKLSGTKALEAMQALFEATRLGYGALPNYGIEVVKVLDYGISNPDATSGGRYSIIKSQKVDGEHFPQDLTDSDGVLTRSFMNPPSADALTAFDQLAVNLTGYYKALLKNGGFLVKELQYANQYVFGSYTAEEEQRLIMVDIEPQTIEVLLPQHKTNNHEVISVQVSELEGLTRSVEIFLGPNSAGQQAIDQLKIDHGITTLADNWQGQIF